MAKCVTTLGRLTFGQMDLPTPPQDETLGQVDILSDFILARHLGFSYTISYF